MDLGLKKLPAWGQVVLYVVLAVGLFGGHYYFWGNDMALKVAATQTTARKVEQENARARIDEKRLPELRAGIAEQTARLAALRNVLPEQKDVGDLLRRIQTLATQSSLTIRGFKPQAVAQREQHAEWPISLQLEGTYHDLGAFFDKVARMPRIINISGIQIKAHGANEPSPATVDAQCTVTTFVLSEAPPPPVAGARRPAAAGARPPAAAR